MQSQQIRKTTNMNYTDESPLLSKIHRGINEAFNKAILKSEIDGDLVLLTDDRFKDAMEFLRTQHMTDEPCSKAGKQQFTTDLQRQWFVHFNFCLSVLVLKKESNTIIAMVAIDVEKRGDNENIDDMTDEGLKKICSLINCVNGQVDIFRIFDIQEILHFRHLCVDRMYRNQGLATKLIGFCLNVYQSMNITPLYAKVNCTSRFSKSIFEKHGFEIVNSIKYSDYFEDGKLVYPNMGDHVFFACLVKKIG